MEIKRQKIVDETIKRLKDFFDDKKFTIGRGKVDIKKSDIPYIYVYEDVEQGVKEQYNNTIYTLPVQIDCAFRSYNEPFIDGNEILVQLKQAIELDKDYGKLCIDYRASLRHVDILLSPIVKASVVYEFIYYEFFGQKGLIEN
jgi:hypothetical protein